MTTTLDASRVRPGGLAGVLGIAVPTIGVIVLPIWQFPGTGATSGQITRFVSEHHGALQAMMVLYSSGVAFWLVFGTYVFARMREAIDGGSALPTCFAAGLIGFVTLLLAGFTAFDVLVYRGGEPGNARLLYDLTFGLLAMSGVPTALSLAAFAIGAYRHGTFSRYTAHLAAAGAASHILLLASFIAGSGFLSLEGPVIIVIPAFLWAWILATGIELMTAG